MLFEKTIYPDDFPLNIQIIQVDEIPFHYHQDVELVYVLKGEIRLKNGYYNYLLKEGDIFTNSGHEVHGLRATDSDNVIAVIQISNRFFTQYFPQLPKACFRTYVNDDRYARLEDLRGMLLHILLDYTRRSFNYKSTCIYQMIDIIKYLNQYFNLFAFENQVVVNFKNNNPVIVERISHIINYVYENYANRITLEELSKREHLSSFYLSHLIHTYMGISFQKFLCFARSEMSEIPLLETNDKISTVAKKVGFSTTAYYEKFFREWFGHSPQEHRVLFQTHILNESNPPRLQQLTETLSVGLIARTLAAMADHEISPTIQHIQLNVSIADDVPSILHLEHSFTAVLTLEDYTFLGSRLFGLLMDLNIEKIILYCPQEAQDNSASSFEFAEMHHRLRALGYEVTVSEDSDPECSGYRTSAVYDSIVAAIHIFRTYFSSLRTNVTLRLRDPGEPQKILKGFPACITSCGIPKPAFYAYQLLKNIRGELLYQEKNYYVIQSQQNPVTSDINKPSYTSYAIVVMNYNDDIEHLYTRSTDVYKTNESIHAFMDELNIDFSLPVSSGQYMIAKYTFSNEHSIFMHMAHLHFPEQCPMPDHWLSLLNTSPQTQISIEQAENELNISASIHGVGINMIIVEEIL